MRVGLKSNLTGSKDLGPVPKRKITPAQKQTLMERLNKAVEAKKAKQQEKLKKSMWGKLNPAEQARVKKMYQQFKKELLEARNDMHQMNVTNLSDEEINQAALMMVKEKLPEMFGIRHDGTQPVQNRTNEGKPAAPEREAGPEVQGVDNPFSDGGPIKTNE